MKLSLRYILSLSFLVFILTELNAQERISEEVDLEPRWRVFEEGKFCEPKDRKATTIHFPISPKERYDTLLLISTDVFSVFVNNRWYGQFSKRWKVELDALFQNAHTQDLTISVHGEANVKSTLITHRYKVAEQPREKNAFLNFTQTTSVVLLIFFTALLNANPKLTLDYLNINKFLLLQEREENLVTQRTGSSINFIFYAFCSPLWSLLFMILVSQSGEFMFQWSFETSSFGGFLYQWLKISFLFFVLLMFKYFVISALSLLFNCKEVAGFQFFLSVRLLMILGAVVIIFLLTFFILGVRSNLYYYYLIINSMVVIAAGYALAFFKLLNRVSFRFFHLFSYLCVSEIIPFLIFVKVLFK